MEKDVEKYLVKRINEMRGLCVKFPPLFFAGFPDRICILPKGVVIFVETKADGKKPRPLQRRIHLKLEMLGQRVEVLDTIEAVDAFIIGL